MSTATDHQPEPGPEIFDHCGQPVLHSDRDVGPRFPLYAMCTEGDFGVWRGSTEREWRHLARCRHCPEPIEQIPGSGIWTTFDGMTVCIKGQGLDVGVLHEPIPEF